MASLKTEKLIHFTRLIYKIAKDIDKQLFFNNIGVYQDLCFYHSLRGNLTFNDFNKKDSLEIMYQSLKTNWDNMRLKHLV